jgi:hypothetical protein
VVDRYFVARLPDLLIHHLFLDGEVGLPVKIEPDFGHGGRWRRLCVATLLKASSLQLSSRRATAGEILDLGHLDRMMATCEAVLPLGAIVFGEDNG